MAGLGNIIHQAESAAERESKQGNAGDEDITKLVDAFGHVGIVPGGGHYVNNIVHNYLGAEDHPKVRKAYPSLFNPDSWIGGQGIIHAEGRFCIFDDAKMESIEAIPCRGTKTVIWAPIVTEAMSREELRHLDDVRDTVVTEVGDVDTRRIFRLDMCQTPSLAVRVMKMRKCYAARVSQPIVCLMC